MNPWSAPCILQAYQSGVPGRLGLAQGCRLARTGRVYRILTLDPTSPILAAPGVLETGLVVKGLRAARNSVPSAEWKLSIQIAVCTFKSTDNLFQVVKCPF